MADQFIDRDAELGSEEEDEDFDETGQQREKPNSVNGLDDSSEEEDEDDDDKLRQVGRHCQVTIRRRVANQWFDRTVQAGLSMTRMRKRKMLVERSAESVKGERTAKRMRRSMKKTWILLVSRPNPKTQHM